MAILEAPVRDRAEVMYVKNGTAVSVLAFNVSEYCKADLFVRSRKS